MREAAEGRKPPLGSDSPSRERIVAILDAILTFKLENSRLIRARELYSSGVQRTGHYQWVHGLLQELIEDAAPGTADAGYLAHVLLAALHIDLLGELLATGRSAEAIRQAQTALAHAVIDGAVRE